MTPIDIWSDDEMPPAKGRHLHPTPIKPADADPSDTFAPPPPGCRCVDPEGYRRRQHDYDRDGVCLWCSRRRRMERLG